MANAHIKTAGPAYPGAEKAVTVTDARQRVLTMAEPDFLSEFRLMEAVGPDLASNSSWMAVFAPLTYITAIDGDPVLPPMNKVQAEVLIQKVGRDGYAAVLKGLKEHFSANAVDLDFAKNSAGTPDSASV